MLLLLEIKSCSPFLLFFLFYYIIMSFPFLHESYPEANTFVLGIPLSSHSGRNYLGITALMLLAVSLVLMALSLEKYQGRFVLAAIVIAGIAPQFLANTYQKTFASAIYAISYEQESSECDITRAESQTVAECELILMNHSDNDVALSVEFANNFSEEAEPMIDIVNHDAPYDVRLLGKERKTVTIHTKIDTSESENKIGGGHMQMMNIIIRSEGEERGL
ncbi:hypothetical protein ACDX78_03310 [Virgibacillus oceani]